MNLFRPQQCIRGSYEVHSLSTLHAIPPFMQHDSGDNILLKAGTIQEDCPGRRLDR